MSISAGNFRNGAVFERSGNLFQVVEFQHVKPGKGPAFVRAKIRNLYTGSLTEEKFRPDEKYEEVRVESTKMIYSYPEGDEFLVMQNQEDWSEVRINKEMLGKQVELLIEGEEVTLAMNGDEPISAELPLGVVREVEFCEPGVKGDTATNATKPATLEGGAVVNVPLFINQGDKIKVDTRTFSYIERAKE